MRDQPTLYSVREKLKARYHTDDDGALCILQSAAEHAYFPGLYNRHAVAAAINLTTEELDAALIEMGVLMPHTTH